MKNSEYASMLKSILGLRYEPVAVKLIRRDEPDPVGYSLPDKQMSHCQAVMSAKAGNSVYLSDAMQGCNVGASALGLREAGEKVTNGEFHFNFGVHDTQEAAAEMIASRSELPQIYKGEIITPLKEADFVPDSVIIVDIPERFYWFVLLKTHEKGGRAVFTTAPFQAVCVDCTVYPILNSEINISLGCYGCRRRTDIRQEELIVGFPGIRLEEIVTVLKKYNEEGDRPLLSKAKRD